MSRLAAHAQCGIKFGGALEGLFGGNKKDELRSMSRRDEQAGFGW
jgi:hypothetical protein